MEEKKVTKISLSTAILCFIIFALIIGMIFMYIYYNRKDDNAKNTVETDTINSNNIIKEDDNTQLSNNTVNNSTTQISKNEALNVNSELVKRLYDYIPVIDVMTYTPYNAYQTNKVTLNNIDTKYILGCAFTKLSLTDKDKLPYENEDGTTEGPYDGWFSFKSDILQEKVKELYGQNVENLDFSYSGDAVGCTYKNGKYMHSSGGYVGQNLISIRKIEKSYIDGDDLIIEDKYIALKHDDGEGNVNETNELFASSNSVSGIKKISFDIIEKTHENISTEIINAYGDIMTKYKHTFKKKVDGSYYWYSTEPIK